MDLEHTGNLLRVLGDQLVDKNYDIIDMGADHCLRLLHPRHELVEGFWVGLYQSILKWGYPVPRGIGIRPSG